MPGGGYANLDLFERLAATPGVTVVGTAGRGFLSPDCTAGRPRTSPMIAERHARLMSYRDHYEELRKRPFRGPGKPRHFVGRVAGAALRTRPRWMTPQAFRDTDAVRANGLPEKPAPIPEQLQDQYTDAFWRSLAWREVKWLGTDVERAPTDLVAYQELVAEVRPDWIVELGGGDGQAKFFASLCDLVGSGRVLSVREDAAGQPEHPRITYAHRHADR